MTSTLGSLGATGVPSMPVGLSVNMLLEEGGGAFGSGTLLPPWDSHHHAGFSDGTCSTVSLMRRGKEPFNELCRLCGSLTDANSVVPLAGSMGPVAVPAASLPAAKPVLAKNPVKDMAIAPRTNFILALSINKTSLIVSEFTYQMARCINGNIGYWFLPFH